MFCNNSWGGNNFLWIIILIILFSGCGCNNGCNNNCGCNFCESNNSCC